METKLVTKIKAIIEDKLEALTQVKNNKQVNGASNDEIETIALKLLNKKFEQLNIDQNEK